MKSLFKIWGTNISIKMAAIAMVCSTGLYHTAKAQETAANNATAITAPVSNTEEKVNAIFPGGIDNFYSYISSKLKPDTTCCPGKKIYVTFMVDKEGKMCHVKVRGHDLSDKMNAQLVKIFESAPQWSPAKQNGQEIKEHFVCPVMFMPKADLMAANTPVKN